jgi:uncharacterized protein (DUF1501 family)
VRHDLPRQRAILCTAGEVQAQLEEQRRLWDRGFTRRRFLAGAGMAAAASLGSQLVTTRHAFAAAGTGTGKTLVSIFLRGGMDGLTTVVPRNDPHYLDARPGVGVRDSELLALDSVFGLHPAMAPVHRYWQSKQLAFVHAVGSPDANRDHFAAQALIERGDKTLSTPSGWLDRVLMADGPGTTFRAVCEGSTVTAALRATLDAIAMRGIDTLDFANPSTNIATALRSLYTGLDHPIEDLMDTTVRAVADAVPIRAQDPNWQPRPEYTADPFGAALADIARLVKANAGLRVATVDVGGWDLHTNQGTAASGQMVDHLTSLAQNLNAIATDLGSRIADVTLVAMSEFGRRVVENTSGGTDHGSGGLLLLLGGGVQGGQIHGGWPGLAPGDLDNGDLAVRNDCRDVLGEVAGRTLNLGSLTSLFPGHQVSPLGVMK